MHPLWRIHCAETPYMDAIMRIVQFVLYWNAATEGQNHQNRKKYDHIHLWMDTIKPVVVPPDT